MSTKAGVLRLRLRTLITSSLIRRHGDTFERDGILWCLSCGERTGQAKNSTSNHSGDLPNEHGNTASAYKHHRIAFSGGQEIRPSKLPPRPFNDRIICQFCHVNLLDRPSLAALSYTWVTEEGDDDQTEILKCSGKNMTITKTCDAALRALSRPGCKCAWVDMICIDQQESPERNHQVGLMNEIDSGVSLSPHPNRFRSPQLHLTR